MSAVAIAIIAVGVVLMAVLVPLLLAQGRCLGRVKAHIERIEDTLHALAERVARIEGALTGPWRSTNGSRGNVQRHLGNHRQAIR